MTDDTVVRQTVHELGGKLLMPDELASQIADMAGVYGTCHTTASDCGCHEADHLFLMHRPVFESAMAQLIRESVKNELALQAKEDTHGTTDQR